MLSVSEGLFLKIFAKCLICFSRGGVGGWWWWWWGLLHLKTPKLGSQSQSFLESPVSGMLSVCGCSREAWSPVLVVVVVVVVGSLDTMLGFC